MEEYETTNMMIYLYTIYDKSKKIYKNYGLKIIARLSKSAGAQSSYFAACPAEKQIIWRVDKDFLIKIPLTKNLQQGQIQHQK